MSLKTLYMFFYPRNASNIFSMENISINGSAKQSYWSIHRQPWHVVKMITFLKIIMTETQNTVNKHSFSVSRRKQKHTNENEEN